MVKKQLSVLHGKGKPVLLLHQPSFSHRNKAFRVGQRLHTDRKLTSVGSVPDLFFHLAPLPLIPIRYCRYFLLFSNQPPVFIHFPAGSAGFAKQAAALAFHVKGFSAGAALIQCHMQSFGPPGIGYGYLFFPLPLILIIPQMFFYFLLNIVFLCLRQLFFRINALQLSPQRHLPGVCLIPKRSGKITSVDGQHHYGHLHKLRKLSHILRDIGGGSRVGMPGLGKDSHYLPVLMQSSIDIFHHSYIGNISSLSDTANPSVQPFPECGKAFHIGHIVGSVGEQGQRCDIIVGKALMGGEHQIRRFHLFHPCFFDLQPQASGHQPGSSPDKGKQEGILLYRLFIHVKGCHIFLFVVQHACLHPAVSAKESSSGLFSVFFCLL